MSERGQFAQTIGEGVPALRRLWQNSTPSQRLGLGAFFLICVGLLAMVAALAHRPHYAVLYANLQQEDAAEVIKRLRELKIPYRVGANGMIEAPADRIDELRLDLAADGLPAGGQTGFELLDRSRIGMSDFGEQLTYQRALQGELARTITRLDSVEQARVHVAIPHERLYESEEEKPTASVVLKLRGGRQLTSAQVASVVHLVSGAVGGMAPEAVTILDTRGRLLSSADDRGAAQVSVGSASDQLQIRREYEREIEQAVQSMLDGVVGQGKTMVRVSASLDFERTESEREVYQPAADGNGVLQSRRETKETYHGLAEPGPIGIPGVSSNSAAAIKTSKTQPRADQYEHNESSSEYRISRQVDRTVRPPGQLKRLSVAVIVDEEARIGKLDELKAAVAAAAGLDANRGDTVVISRAPFEPPTVEEKGSKVFAIRDFYINVGRDLAAIALMVLFLRFAGRMLHRRAPAALGGAAVQVRTSSAGASQTGPVGTAREAPTAPSESTPVATSFDPDRAAAVLRSWLGSEQSREAQAAARPASEV